MKSPLYNFYKKKNNPSGDNRPTETTKFGFHVTSWFDLTLQVENSGTISFKMTQQLFWAYFAARLMSEGKSITWLSSSLTWSINKSASQNIFKRGIYPHPFSMHIMIIFGVHNFNFIVRPRSQVIEIQ